MKRMRAVVMICCFVLAAALLGAAPGAAAAEAASKDRVATIRVAFPIQTGLSYFDANGGRAGYFYEYLEEVSQFTEWKYEFVDYPEGDDQGILSMLDDLRTGAVDIGGFFTYDETLAAQFGFGYASYHSGTRYTVLQTLLNASAPALDAQRDQHFRIAVIEGSKSMTADLDAYCQAYRVTYDRVECANVEEQIAALRAGDADLMLNGNFTYAQGVKTVARFAPRPIYFVVSNLSPILEELNRAILELEQSDPDFAGALFEKYFTAKNTELVFSAAEEAYLAAAGPVRVGVLTSQAPYQYRRDDVFGGINVALLGLLAQKTGLEFVYTAAATEEDLYALAERAEVDLLAGMPYDYDIARLRNLAMTRTFISASYVLMLNPRVSESDLAGKRLALPASSSYHGEFAGIPVRYGTAAECVEAVRSGAADYTYVDSYTAQYYKNRSAYDKLKLVPQTGDPRRISFGIVKAGNGELRSVCNKVISLLSQAELQELINAEIFAVQRYTLATLIVENPVAFVLTVLGLVAAAAAAVAAVLVYRARMNKKSKLELSKLHRVFALVNEYFFEYDFHKRKFTVSVPDDSGTASVREYEFAEEPGTDDLAESRGKLASLLYSKDNAATLSLASGDERHWYRIAVERMFDGGEPVFAIGKLTRVDEEMARESELQERVKLDSLTGIYNSGTIRDLISGDLAKEADGVRALILLDVDNFKNVNDTYGHLEGDRTLQKVASALKEKYADRGFVGRPGGDEFTFYCRLETEDALAGLCGELCASAREIALSDGATLTFSVGAAIVAPGDRYDEVYQRADSALYAAKRAGRDGYRIASARRGGG